MLFGFRILDNLPQVVPIQRLDQEAPPLYQLGFHVGLKGQFTGVSISIVITDVPTFFTLFYFL